MQTPNQIKLAIGAEIVFTVDAVRPIKVGKWPELEWLGVEPNGIPVIVTTPQAAMDRQFAKLKLSAHQMAGYTVKIERVPQQEDASKSWWNLHILAENEAKPQPTSKRAAAGLSAPPKADPDDPGPISLGEAPAPQRAASEAVDAAEQQRTAIERHFDAIWKRQAAIQTQLSMEGRGFPFDAASITSAAATVLIQQDRAGLLRSLPLTED